MMGDRELWVTVFCKALEVLYLKQSCPLEELQAKATDVANKALEDAPEDKP